MKLENIRALLEEKFPNCILEEGLDDTPQSFTVPKELIFDICLFLRDMEGLFFDQLSCLTGIDNGPESNKMEVVYNLYSIPFNFQLMLKTVLSRSNPSIKSVSQVWKTADWHEREAFDLLGITFEGHPDLRRILLPRDWEGHPLRKDYQLQDYYHGIKVEY